VGTGFPRLAPTYEVITTDVKFGPFAAPGTPSGKQPGPAEHLFCRARLLASAQFVLSERPPHDAASCLASFRTARRWSSSHDSHTLLMTQPLPPQVRQDGSTLPGWTW